MHDRIAQSALDNLDKDKAEYFADVLGRLEEDGRTELYPNIVYTVLRETMWMLPVYLEKKEFIDLLFRFVAGRNKAIQRRMFARNYIDNPSTLRTITDDQMAELHLCPHDILPNWNYTLLPRNLN